MAVRTISPRLTTRTAAMVTSVALACAAMTLPVRGQGDKSAGPAAAGTVAGTVVVNGTKVALKHGYAYAYGQKLVSVLLADRPVTAAAFKENFFATDPVPPGLVMGAWKSLFSEGKVRGLVLTFAADRSLMLDEVLVGKASDAFSVTSSEYTVALDQLTGSRVSGTIKTVKPTIEVGSLKYGLDASFDVPVVPLPK